MFSWQSVHLVIWFWQLNSATNTSQWHHSALAFQNFPGENPRTPHKNVAPSALVGHGDTASPCPTETTLLLPPIIFFYKLSAYTSFQPSYATGHKWHSLYGWLGARKTCPSALAMELRLSCINPSISSLAWVWWVITRKYGEHSSLLCENAVLFNMTDRGYSLPEGISVGMRPANERRHCNVKMSLMGWAHT